MSDPESERKSIDALKVVVGSGGVQGEALAGESPPVLICHDQSHFDAVYQAARRHDIDLVARTAPGATRYAGIGFLNRCRCGSVKRWGADRVEAVLDCGDDAASAVAAMADGWETLLFDGHERARAKLRALCRPGGIGVVAERRAATLDLASVAAPLPACLAVAKKAALSIIAGGDGHGGGGHDDGRDNRGIRGSEIMRVTTRVKKILAGFESDNPGTKGNLARILMHGKLGGSGHLVILPVDQGFEHGPARSFAPNPPAYDPHYHFKLAVDAGLNAYAAPLGMIEAGADSFAGAVPTILKMNSSNSLATEKDQAVYGSVRDALRLGCAAIGFTIYPASDHQFAMMEELRALAEEAKAHGLAVVVWSYPRGGKLSKDGETAIDIAAYAAHLACLLGAHIVKVKLPTAHLEQAEAKKVYQAQSVDIAGLAARVAHVVQACFDGRRLVVFSGGAAKDLDGLYDEVRAIRDGGGNGSIIGRNTFQRPRDDALAMLDTIIRIYQGKA